MARRKAWRSELPPGKWRRWLPHRHKPFHPGPYQLWYCRRCRRALCDQSWLPGGRWIAYKPYVYWRGPVKHWGLPL